MSGYYLCTVRHAAHPFYIETIDLHLYTIEELCYYLQQNVYLIDETIVNEKLCSWLGEELGLKRLQLRLTRVLEHEQDELAFVLPIFEESGYLSQQELEYFRDQMLEVLQEPVQIRQKMKGDYLVMYGKYTSAIAEYREILRKQSFARMGVQFYAVVLENMAAAYAKMFRFEEAAECLWESYQTLRSKKVYEKYLRLLPLYMTEKEWQNRLAEIKADRDEANRLRADNEAIFREAQESELTQAWEGRSMDEQVEALRAEYLGI
ncbi:MAG: hypothetical protein Q4B57_02565 [Eubacteriales bacterium]|nr:hypothetical protein [Eubacteriales bacterium]